LGAKCVLVGRPYAYGLAIGGQDGVKHVLNSLMGDTIMNMHLGGLRGLSELNRDILIKDNEV
jgi:lactate 2-monooxygenase